MTLAELREGWDHAAREDAMGNIVTISDLTPDEFWQRGCDEINAVLRRLDDIGVEYKTRRALDFGCGVGRLTSALAPHFERADGVDISPEMVDRARTLSVWPRKVAYHVNSERIPFRDRTFDLIYSSITLQHMCRELQHGYVAEFVRLLRKDGVAVFQIPEVGSSHPHSWLAMHGTPRVEVERWVAEAGGRVCDIDPRPEGNCASCTYTVTR